MSASIFSISLISLLATFAVADNLFSDLTDSNLAIGSDSSDSFFLNNAGTDAGTDDQLLAFNDNSTPNPFTSDSSLTPSDSFLTPSNGADGSLPVANLPNDSSNLFLDDSPTSAAEGVPLSNLDPSDFLTSLNSDSASGGAVGSDPLSSTADNNLLAANPADDCSSYQPSSRNRKIRRGVGSCTVGPDGNIHPPYGFMEKTEAEQAKIYSEVVCPSEHWEGAQTPVCSSDNPSQISKFQNEMYLAESTLCWFFVHLCISWKLTVHLCS